MILKVAFSLIMFSVLANGQSLTKKPTNTADIVGSSNITFECASIYGIDQTSWHFTPLGSLWNETIQISCGCQLHTSSEQYQVDATVNNSTVLVVRQLSNVTEGTYICYDGVEIATALLLVIPLPISIEPLFGPIAGGTKMTIIGSSTVDYISRNFGSYIPEIIGVRDVYIGNDLSAPSVPSLPNGGSTFDVVAVTPSTTEASIGQPLPVIIEFSPTLFNMTPFNMTFNRAFTYLENPEITRIYPNNFIVTGGTDLDVFGQGLSSVTKPIIQLTVVITRAAENSSTSNTSTTSTSRVCTVPSGNDTYMQCPMPPLSLPDDFLEILNLQYNISTTRRRRHARSRINFLANFHSPLFRLKRDINTVLTVYGRNGVDRADIYLGFILDGYKEYENINDALPDTKIVFNSAPEINSSDQLFDFDPSEDDLIFVKGRYMLRGCRLRDYLVHIGNQICTNSVLQDNQLSCRPPKEKPSSTLNDAVSCDQHLSITITLGYKQYQYGCVTYTDHSATKKVALIVGLTVGLGGFAIFLTILIVCIVRCRSKKVTQKTDRPQKKKENKKIRKPNYNNAVQPESNQDNGHQRQQFDDYMQPNNPVQPKDDYLTSAA